ncbi:MAG TPA: hypothetical protein PKZ62_06510 [Thermoclostridium caenicola]|nr:hypothetical protein [Thermoclostridium caenicola]HOL84939.1 hypothetical protein [Thermoclostridium caenicola]HPO77067.1 hypothetical protein [Thermoclostridium caenicola]
MNEHRKSKKFQSYINSINNRLTSMNKGSKTLLRIASIALLAGILFAAFLLVSTQAGLKLFENQLQMVEWVIIYIFRVWGLLVCGALILDYLKGGQDS